jgi:ribosomal protein S18 acetylase RimI-like enzyme
MIKYQNTLEGISPQMLNGGFFVNWTNFPSPEKHLQILLNSNHVVLAVENNEKVIGFINAVSDKILCSYIPLLEVLPEYQKRGIGKELVSRMFKILEDYYMADLCCDEDLENYYRKFGMEKRCGMIKRNYNKQKGM